MDCRFVSFGLVEIEGKPYDRDIVIESGHVRRRRKGPSKPRRPEYGHTPLTPDEEIPWSTPRLIVGTGASGQLPISDDFFREAADRGVDVMAMPTADACAALSAADPATVSAILHVTC